MKFEYGKALKLKDNITLKFYVDGVYPSGQLGYKEPHYKILFDEAYLVIAESLAEVLFEIKNVDEKKIETKEPINLKKLNKDDLIALAAQIDTTGDLTKLRKEQLIEIIEKK